MFPTSRKNSSWEEPFTIASPHVVYRSNWLERTPEIENLLSKTVRNLSNLRSSDLLVKVENGNTTKDIILRTSISLTELREVEVFFYLFVKDLTYKNNLYQVMEEINGQSISSIEKAILASLFLNKNQVDKLTMMKQLEEKDILVSLSNEYFEDPYSNRCNWKVPLPENLNELMLREEESDKSWLEEEIDGLRWISYVEKVNLKTESYYHINKGELMERVRHLLCRGLFDNEEPKDMEEVEELYDRLLNFRGAIMWMTASNQFPEDEVVFLWNRSMIGQSLEEAWNLPLTRQSLDEFLNRKRKERDLRRFWLKINDPIPNFTVTHHGMVKDGDKLIPTMDTEVWTNDQLRDALGYDWMFDQRLTLEDNWMNIKKEADLRIVKERLFGLISSSLVIGLLIRTDSNQLFLEEFSPIEILRRVNLDNEKKLVEQDSNEPRNLIARTRLIPDFFIDLPNNPSIYVPTGDDYYQSRNERDEVVEDTLDGQVW